MEATELQLSGQTWSDQIDVLADPAVNSVSSANSQRAYRAALVEFLTWCRRRQMDVFSKALVQRYHSELERSKLSASAINVRLSAVRKLAAEAADNGFLRPELAAGIQRVPGIPRRGRPWHKASELLQRGLGFRDQFRTGSQNSPVLLTFSKHLDLYCRQIAVSGLLPTTRHAFVLTIVTALCETQ